MYTSILLVKTDLRQKYKNDIVFRYKRSRYFKKVLSKTFDKMMNNGFIFKYDDLMELYNLMNNEKQKDNSGFLTVVDDSYDYLTLELNIPDIIKVRINIAIDRHVIEVDINELAINYEANFIFKDKIRFNMYNEKSKDKDQQLVSLCNTLLMKSYIDVLSQIYFDNKAIYTYDISHCMQLYYDSINKGV